MPRRATSTSFGQKDGNPTDRGKPGPGRPPDAFRMRMQVLAARAAEAKRLEKMLGDESDDATFLKAFAETANRGFGTPVQSIDVTSQGERVASLLVLPSEKPAE